MKENRDKYLTEAMGLCWHEDNVEWVKCDKGCSSETPRPSYNDWQGFGTLWEWAIKQEWWWDISHKRSMLSLINPDRFADALYEFLKERG